MRLNELEKTGSIDKRVDDFIRQVSQELSGSRWIYQTKTSNRMWTRGDGVRYKELSKIVTYHTDSEYDNKENNRDLGNLPDNIVTNNDALDYLWDKIKANGKPLGQMSDEFKSMARNDAVLWNGIIFVKRDFSIEYGSKGRLKNSDVWNAK